MKPHFKASFSERGFLYSKNNGAEGKRLIEAQSAFELLTTETAIALVKKLELLDGENLTCQEIGDANLNYVFHITDALTSKGIIIKQAVPYAKMLGESWPLTLKRASIEANALIHFGSYCPNYVPKVYYSDEKLAITVMEDLSHLTIARAGFIDGTSYPLLSQHMGEYCAKTFFHTSDYYLEPSIKTELVRRFAQPELCKITESFVFTDIPTDVESGRSATMKKLWDDPQLLLEVTTLKESLMNEQEALLHGDLHTGSILASETETKVIDPEFAFYGPLGFDMGLFIGNLLFQAISGEESKRDVLFSHIQTFWHTFEKTYTNLWKNEHHDEFKNIEGLLPDILKKTKADSFGFAGCELIRRTIGLAPAIDLEGIPDTNKRISLKKSALAIGTHLVKNRESLDFIDTIAFVKAMTQPAQTV